ncbi:hypothetical protein AB6A40_001251 [Gnathostoma spinigerum]|uniref:SprT-like domain-containing protein n=1 Tax=Gnathostoma spinigerum TaxID=75299 RepID=A0ABD6EDG9_9BILA
MSRHYRRIILEDSSDSSMLSVSNISRNLAEGDQCSSMEDSDANSVNMKESSQLLQNMSIQEDSIKHCKNAATSPRLSSSSALESANTEDTYEEDSFVVKDSSDEYGEDSISDSFSSASIPLSTPSTRVLPPRRVKPGFAHSTPLRNHLLEKSALDSIRNDESRQVLLELYPELVKSSAVSSISKSPKKSVFKEEQKENIGSSSSDESLDKYLDTLRNESRMRSEHEFASENEDLKNFIVSDSESLPDHSFSDVDEEEEREESLLDLDDLIGHRDKRSLKNKSESDSENDKRQLNIVTSPPSDTKDVIRVNLRELFAQPTPRTKHIKVLCDEERFLLALSSAEHYHKDAELFVRSRSFAHVREQLTNKLFAIFRRSCFEEKLDADMRIEWNPRLLKTAGRCRCLPNYVSTVELSTKVCNTPERVRDTLIHELCHAAVWAIDRFPNGRHGPVWKYWVNKCKKVFPSLPPIERCHNYKIDAKFLYICNGCGQTVRRHTKSLDTTKKICGICRGRFELKTKNGKTLKQGQPNKFALFVKANYASERKPGVNHRDVMKILSQRFKTESIEVDQLSVDMSSVSIAVLED